MQKWEVKNCLVWQIWPRSTERSRAKTDRVLSRECTGHSKYPLPTTEKTTHYAWTSPDGQYWNQIDLVAQRLKHLPPMRETWVQSLGQEDPLEKEMAIHSSILAWRIPWMEKPSRLQSMRSQRVRHNWATSPYLTLPLQKYKGSQKTANSQEITCICTHSVQMLMFVCMCVCKLLSCVWLFVTSWTVAQQASLSLGFSR